MTIAVQPHRSTDVRHLVLPVLKAGLGVTLFVLAALLTAQPYERPLLGFGESGQRQVVSTCGPPVVELLDRDGGSNRNLSPDGSWVSGPPCASSAAYRLGLAGFLAIAGAGALAARNRTWTAGLRQM